MKKYLLLSALFFFTSMAIFGQSAEKKETNKKITVPAVVLQSFEKEFPGDKAKWGAEGDMYEAEFKHNREKMSALFTANGQLVQTAIPIKIGGLPSSAIGYLFTYYKGVKIKDVSKIGKVNGVINYEAAVNDKVLIFDVTGNFIEEKTDE